MALGLTQPLTEMSTRNISGGVGGSLKLLEPSAPFQACTGVVLPLPFNIIRLHNIIDKFISRESVYKP